MVHLMIIESPNKIKTINKYLKQQGFAVKATIGHFQQLVGYDPINFEPQFEIINTKSKNLTEIKKLANQAQAIYIATDPDREGEGIAWHIYNYLGKINQKKCHRVTFNEITETAIKKGLEKPQSINQNMVDAYLARSILDQEIGFKLSRFVKKETKAISAGRVQSVVLKLINAREVEINNFVPKYWYVIKVNLDLGQKQVLDLKLIKLNPKYTGFDVFFDNKQEIKFWDLTKQQPQQVINEMQDQFALINVETKIKSIAKPPKAFKTSSLQILITNKLKINSKVAEQILQKLYQGVEINGQQVGLITYPRTDLTDLSEEFVNKAKSYIFDKFGCNYYYGVHKSKKDSNAQGAHEAIRPTDLNLEPNVVKPFLETNSFQVYQLIFNYAVGSLMSFAEYEQTNFEFINNQNHFVGSAKKLIFEGYLKLLKPDKTAENENVDNTNEMILTNPPKLNQTYLPNEIELKQQQTYPPKKYSQSTLIKELESLGIGRPSTYASSVQVNLERNYVSQNSQNQLIMTNLGQNVNQVLTTNFLDLINYQYTAKMEASLDAILKAEINYKQFLKVTFATFHQTLAAAIQANNKAFAHVSVVQTIASLNTNLNSKVTNEICPKCKNKLVIRKYQDKKTSETKTFLGCIKYPKCKFTKFYQM